MAVMISDNLTIYKQIYPSQCCKIAHLGFRSLINIRPDSEIESQPLSADLAAASQKADLAYCYLPFDEDRLSLDTIQKFAEFYNRCPKPVLMFCGTGARAKLLYQSALMQDLL